MEKQIFPLPAAVGGRQMSACAASTLDCAALGTTTWPSLLSHRVWAAVTLRNFSPGWALGTVEGGGGAGERRRARDRPHARVYTDTSRTPCYFSHKRRTKERWPCLLCEEKRSRT